MFLCPSTSVDENCIYVIGLEYKYFLVGTIVRRGVRVEVGVEIHVELFFAETPDCELQRKQTAIFFTVTLIDTYEFMYCWYNSLFKQVVSGDRRAREPALAVPELEKSKWYRLLSRGLVEFRAVLIAEPG